MVIVNGDCNKLRIEGFEEIWGKDYSELSFSAGERTSTHDLILNIDEVLTFMQDTRFGSNNENI